MAGFALAAVALIIVLPGFASTASPVSFSGEIAPLLQRRCGACHDAEQGKGRYRMDTFEHLMKPGESGLSPVVAGQPKESELFNLLLEQSPEDRMPQKADALPQNEISMIERWIAEGATCDGKSPRQPLVEMVRESMLRDAPPKYLRAIPAAAVAFSADGRTVAVSGYYEVNIWNAGDGTLVSRIGNLPERITSIAWHPRLPLLAVAGGSPMQWGTVALVDPMNLAPVRYLCDLPEAALSVAFSPDGNLLAAGCGDRTVRIYDSLTGGERKVLKVHADWVQSVSFSADGQRLLTASRDRTARVIDSESGVVLTSYSMHETPLLAGILSPADSRAWTIARGGVIHRWDAASGEKRGEFKGADFVALIPLEKGVVAVCADRKLRLYGGDKQTETWEGLDSVPQSAALSPDQGTIAVGASDGSVTLIRTSDGTLVGRFVAQPR